jgi:hypothetical protein
MKFILPILIACLSFGLASFRTEDPAPLKSLHVFYVDNSKFSGRLPLSGEMIEWMSKRVDSLKGDKNSQISFFVSNSAKPEYTNSFDRSKKLINALYDGYGSQPNSMLDKPAISAKLFSDDLSDIGLLIFISWLPRIIWLPI